jgi:hypothetical protein
MTPELAAARLGHVTASRIADVMAKGRDGKPLAGRANYAAQIISERLTGVVQESYQNAAMQRGNEKEPDAADAYAFLLGVELETSGFVKHPRILMAGCSPDRLVGSDGLVEFKCPNTATHIDTLLGDDFDRRYYLQAMFQLACAGRQWCDLASYDDRLPPSMRLYVKRIERDEKAIAEIEAEVNKFLAEVDERLCALRAKYEPIKEAA